MINDKDYWEERFSNGSWEENNGKEQSKFFYQIIMDHLPQWMFEELEANNYSICDLGCADGVGTALLKQYFPQSNIVGIDISEAAIEKARKNYPECSFIQTNITQDFDQKFDLILSSNTLEHFQEPISLLKNIIKFASKYFLILVPFREFSRIDEHFYSFDYNSFPLNLENYNLIYYKEINCKEYIERYWPDEQILLVYAHNNYYSQYKLKTFRNGYYEQLKKSFEQIKEYQYFLINELGYLYDRDININNFDDFLEMNRSILIRFKDSISINDRLVKDSQQLLEKINSLSKVEIELSAEIKNKDVLIKQSNLSINLKNEEIEQLELDKGQLEGIIKGLEISNIQLNENNKALELSNIQLNQNIISLNNKNTQLYEDNMQIKSEMDQWKNAYLVTINSHSWQLTKPIRILGDKMKEIKLYLDSFRKLLQKTKNSLKKSGTKGTIEKMVDKAPKAIEYLTETVQISQLSENDDTWKDFIEWLDKEDYSFIDIFHVPMGWDTPLFQRFQHLSLQAGEIGGIAIYGAHPLVDDVEIYKFITPKLCIVNLDNLSVKEQLFKILDNYLCLKYIRLQSIDLATTIEELKDLMSRGYKIVYEYIDELTPQITGNIPEFVLKRHEYILKNLTISVVATSDKLYDQIKPYRNDNMAMINNGVDFAHWHLKKEEVHCPEEIQNIVNQGKIIIGYHGALAQWVDYDLLKKIALDGRFNLLLIGHAHDNFMEKSGLLQLENVYYIGAKPYKDLNKYACFYDIAILPFILNDITKSVSPVKIFEYMALGKPIVTYALPECAKYKTCLLADNQEKFMNNLNKAIDLIADSQYLKTLEHEALENTWRMIAQKTLDLVEMRVKNEEKNM